MVSTHWRCTWALCLCTIVFLSCQRAETTSRDNQPLSRVAVTSATHIGFLDALGQLDKVVAVTNRAQIYTPLPDSVVDLGDATRPNIETLLRLGVDAVLLCSYTGNTLEEQIARVGIRTIAIDEWQETSPLARAEWILTLGDLFDCRERADSIYAAVCQRYNALAEQQKQHTASRAIMSGANFRGTWYVPSGNTYMGCLFRDAGAAYPYYDDKREQSLPLSFEACYATFEKADIWVGCDKRTLQELADTDSKHTWFRAYQTGCVYNWLRQTNRTGGNNFWERGVVHPDEILEDLIHILAGQDDSLHYAEHLR